MKKWDLTGSLELVVCGGTNNLMLLFMSTTRQGIMPYRSSPTPQDDYNMNLHLSYCYNNNNNWWSGCCRVTFITCVCWWCLIKLCYTMYWCFVCFVLFFHFRFQIFVNDQRMASASFETALSTFWKIFVNDQRMASASFETALSTCWKKL